MIRFLRLFFQRAPLLASILLIWFLMAVLALAGRAGGYRNYSTRHGRLPGISVVMRGIHDHVLPWSKAPAEEDILASGDAGEVQDAPEDAKDAEQEEEAQEKTDAAEKDGEKDREPAAPEEEPGTKDGSGQTETGKDPADAKEQESGTGEQKEAEKGTPGGEKESASPEKAPDNTEEKTDRPAGGDLTIPETSCSAVVGAKDYGVADKQYLSPADTVYNTDKKGLFAPDGIYYTLQKVEDSYFTDALFIGDSRTVGLLEYGGMESFTSFLARESTTVYDLLDKGEKMKYTPKGKKTSERTMKDLLSKTKFRKIYLSVGVNELGIPDTKDYYEEYRKVLETVHKLQPEAVIYIQGIMHVSKAKSSKDRVFNNTAIVQRNKAIATLANGRNIFYIDMNEQLCDKNGDLKEELTGDGIHLKASACGLWHNFLKEHAAVLPD